MSFNPIINSISPSEKSVQIHCQNNLQISINPWNQTIWKVFISNKDEKENPSFAVLESPNQPELKYSTSQNEVTVHSPSGNFVEINKEKASIKFSNKSFESVSLIKDWLFTESEKDGTLCGIKFSVDFTDVYGLGEKTTLKKANKKEYVLWNTDAYKYTPETDSLYGSYPFILLCNRKPSKPYFFGIFVDNHSQHKWMLEEGSVKVNYESGSLVFYFIHGDSPSSIIKDFTSLTGKLSLPPLHILGYHQCRWSYSPESKVKAIAEGFRKRNIPCDCIWLDIDYMDGYKCFTWENEKFPNPKELAQWMKDQGFKLIPIIDPGIKNDENYSIYKKLMNGENVAKNPDGTPFIGEVWPGKCVFPDFTKESTRELWGTFYSDLVKETGIISIWNDMNEPAVFDTPHHTMPDDVRFSIGDHRFVHNIYGLLMARATYEGLMKLQQNERPFVLSRAGFAGLQRYAWQWTGDNTSSWEHLKLVIPMLCNLGICGQPGVGCDIGGFFENCNPELYIRWIECCSLVPFCRTHTEWKTIEQEPWSFGDKATDISKKFIELRYKLMPYLYTWMRHTCLTGEPLMRPLFYQYPNDNESYSSEWENSEYFVGPDILVAPILEAQTYKRRVYLPPGEWFDFFNRQKYNGNQVIEVSANLPELPLFVRSGTVIPVRAETARNVYDNLKTKLEFLHFGDEKECEGILYLDDGSSFDYKKGKYGLYKINHNGINKLLEGEGFNIL